MSRQLTVRILGIAVALSVSGVAQAKKHKYHKYVGGHPLAERQYCYIEAPHIHVFAPANGNKKRIKLEYRVYDEHYHFVGDPVPAGYDGDPHGYYGHHPIAVDVETGVYVEGRPHDIEYCYLDGPHFHAYAPPPDLKFEVKGGVSWYVGEYPREYERDKRAMVQINPIYAEVQYERPVVEVDPPEAYLGPIVEVHAHVPVVEVEAPAARAEVHGGVEVDVHIPTPTLEVEVGLPGVVVIDDHHHHGKVRHRKHKKHKKFKRGKRRGGKKRVKGGWRLK